MSKKTTKTTFDIKTASKALRAAAVQLFTVAECFPIGDKRGDRFGKTVARFGKLADRWEKKGDTVANKRVKLEARLQKAKDQIAKLEAALA